MVDKKAEAAHKDSSIREEEYQKPEKYLVLRGRAGDSFFLSLFWHLSTQQIVCGHIRWDILTLFIFKSEIMVAAAAALTGC